MPTSVCLGILLMWSFADDVFVSFYSFRSSRGLYRDIFRWLIVDRLLWRFSGFFVIAFILSLLLISPLVTD